MKYTKKLQQGGFVSYMPVPISSPAMPTAPSGAVSASAQNNGSSWLDEDLKKEIITKGGLTNETNALISQLLEIDRQNANPFLQSMNRSNSLALIGQINELKQNKAMWEQSYDISKASGGLGEIAVGNSGEIYVKDQENNLKAISISEYKKNSDKLRALSVAELLEERNSNPLLKGQNNIFNVANNSIGIEKISDYAQKITKILGTEVTKMENIYDRDEVNSNLRAISAEIQAKGKTPTSEELKGFAILNTIKDSPSKYNEVLTESSTQRNHALKAAKYIWSTLGTNAQNKLAAQAAINGVDPSQMLLDLIVIGTDESSSTTVRPISESKAKTGNGSESTTGTTHLTETEMLMRGTLGTGQKFIFNDPENSTKFEGLITGTMAFTTAKGNKPMGATTLFGILKQGEWERLVDTNNIYFGNKKVENYQQNDIIFDGMSDIGRVYLPVKSDGSPDNESMAEFRQVMDIYDKNKDSMSKSEVQRLFRNSGFMVKINEDKTLEVSAVGANVKPFLIAYGYTNDASSLIEDNTNTKVGGLRRLEKNEAEGMKSIEDIAWTGGSGKNTYSLKPKEGAIKRLFTGTDRYKGIVYMPERSGATATASAMVGSGPRALPVSESQVMSNMRNTSGVPFITTNISAFDE